MKEGEGRTVTEAQVQAYVDGQLGDDECAAVEAHLAADPAAFERVKAYLTQNRDLCALFDAHAVTPLPDRIKALGAELAGALAARRRP